MTTIVCISYLHQHVVDAPARDLLLIAGDDDQLRLFGPEV